MTQEFPTQAPGVVALVVAAGVLALLVWAVWRRLWLRTSEQDPGIEFFLMGKRAGFLRLAISYCATLLSAFTFIGLPGFFYSHGIGTWLFIPLSNICAILIFYFFGRVFIRLQEEYGTYSPLEIISRAYGMPALGALAFVISAVFIIPHLAVQLAGFGRLATSLGWNYEIALLLLATAFVGYTVFAGMEGDVDTDLVQAGIMFVGLSLVSWRLLAHWDFQPTMMFKDVEETGGTSLLSLPGPNGLYRHSTLVSYVVIFTSVTIVQIPYAMRLLIAKGRREIRKAAIVLPWILLCFFLPTALIGLAGAALFPGLESGDHVMGRVLVAFFGGTSAVDIILVSLVVLGLVFAVISTVDSQLLGLGATFARDVFSLPRRTRELGSSPAGEGRESQAGRGLAKGEVAVSRIVMVVVGLGAFITALSPPRLIIQLSVLSVAGTVQMLPMFIGAVVAERRRPAARSALASVLSGLVTFVLLEWWFTDLTLWGMHPGFVGLIVGTLVMIAAEAVRGGE